MSIVKKWVEADWLQCAALSNTPMCVSAGGDSLSRCLHQAASKKIEA